MTDPMTFGPEWLRNLSCDGSTPNTGGPQLRCQLAEYRYGREEMLGLFEKWLRAPISLSTFSPLYSEQALSPLSLVPSSEEERQWSARGPVPGTIRGRGAAGTGERGGRISRGGGGGRGAYQPYGGGRSVGYESGGTGGWGGEDQTEWSPRKEYTPYGRSASSGGGVDNWRRTSRTEEDERWRNSGPQGRGGVAGEKWNRPSSWREGDDDKGGEKSRGGWHDGQRSMSQRRAHDMEDHLPEWATENMTEGGGTFDATGAFHGSDDEDGKGYKKEHPLQKSASQHTITSKSNHPPLSTSKSAVALSKPPEPTVKEDERKEISNHVQAPVKLKEVKEKKDTKDSNPPPNVINDAPPPQEEANLKPAKSITEADVDSPANRFVDDDLDRLQEALVSKLVVEEEPSAAAPHVLHRNGVQAPPHPPPNMMPMQEKWYYQDPQGDLQGPFLSTEMAEWFRAGYFSMNLFVKRQCDERFYTLGDLVSLSGGNPFQATPHIAPIKQLLQWQMGIRAAGFPFAADEMWNAQNNLQARELMAQQLRAAQHQMAPDPYLQTAGNPLLHTLNQLQQVQVNNLPIPSNVGEKPPPNAMPSQLDALQTLVHKMGGLPNLPRAQPTPNLGQPIGHPPHMKPDPTNIASLHGLPMNGLVGTNVPVLQNNLIGGMPKNILGKLEGDPSANFLQMFQKGPIDQRELDLWKRNQFVNQQSNQQPPPPALPQWQQSEKTISLWDNPTPPTIPSTPPELQQQQQQPPPPPLQPVIVENSKEKSPLNDATKESRKEEKKRKENEEKQAKKEAEEKRRQEQRRLEAEKREQDEQRRKEEERIKRELEKAKKEAEEKRQRELDEKRRLREQRKAEEAKKKADELKKLEEQEREKIIAKEREELQKKQIEYARQAAQKNAKSAPWSQSASNLGLSLSEIQKLERERKAEQVALMQQQRLQQQLQEQTSPEKPNMHLNWASISMKPTKSLIEIQAEEQERLLKQLATEKNLQQKEKEVLSPPTSGIWSAQNLRWSSNDNPACGGFWDEPPPPQPKPVNRVQPAAEPKQINSVIRPAVAKPPKAKSAKKEEQMNNNVTDDFAEWCTKTLASMNSQVDIPTFVAFLRDIESALDVREYCRDYLGDKPSTQHFAAQFLEKRRLFKPKVTSHKDDMCSPAPAITPSTQHSNMDFQEVKGKGKKCKKSKMLKVDARILGFNVTAAQDRINVGDRDYGDTT